MTTSDYLKVQTNSDEVNKQHIPPENFSHPEESSEKIIQQNCIVYTSQQVDDLIITSKC